MKVFISWSGKRSQTIASALHAWIPDVVQRAEPWMSAEDIRGGANWVAEILDQLAGTNFGILCITEESLSSPWLLFEAGALAKQLDAKVTPLLFGVAPNDLPGPLRFRQAHIGNRAGISRLIADTLGPPHVDRGDDALARFWSTHVA